MQYAPVCCFILSTSLGCEGWPVQQEQVAKLSVSELSKTTVPKGTRGKFCSWGLDTNTAHLQHFPCPFCPAAVCSNLFVFGEFLTRLHFQCWFFSNSPFLVCLDLQKFRDQEECKNLCVEDATMIKTWIMLEPYQPWLCPFYTRFKPSLEFV